MHGLLSRLAGIDSAAERGLRVIEFFDQLMAHRADIEAVVRATAVLAETTAGCVFDISGEICVVDPDGRLNSSAALGPKALIKDVVIDDQVVGRVWLEHTDQSGEHEWDELIVDRMALTLANLRKGADDVTRLGLAHPALLHVLIRGSGAETEAARAARLLGFAVGQQVQAIAVVREDGVQPVLAPLRQKLSRLAGAQAVAAAISTTLAVVILATDRPVHLPLTDATVACAGPPCAVEQSAVSWAQARRAVRFARPGSYSAWVNVTDLGCVVALADLPRDEVPQFPDTRAVATLAGRRSGADDIEVLDALCVQPSIREAAAILHMHHSSVSYRVSKISEVMGFDIRTPQGRFRARTALLLWQLSCADDRLAPAAYLHGVGDPSSTVRLPVLTEHRS
jgi:PucR C-terminal helix-turn-helix domain